MKLQSSYLKRIDIPIKRSFMDWLFRVKHLPTYRYELTARFDEIPPVGADVLMRYTKGLLTKQHIFKVADRHHLHVTLISHAPDTEVITPGQATHGKFSVLGSRFGEFNSPGGR